MGRLLTLIKVAIPALAVIACGSHAASTQPKPPPRLEQPSSSAEKQRNKEAPPKLIAPPPAYGHKIVMANGPKVRSNN